MPIDKETQYNVTIKDAKGVETLRIKPYDDLLIGRFKFTGYCQDFVRIDAADSSGQIYIDTVVFKKVLENN